MSEKSQKVKIKKNESCSYGNFLFDGERLDDLEYDGLKIIQNKNLYCFSSDAVLLCNFVKAKKSDTIVDLCSGSGVVGILAQAKTKAKNLIMIEKQPALFDMCQRSLKLNNIESRAKVFCADILDTSKILKENFNFQEVDVVCANPPYYLPTQKKLSGKSQIDIAKFEIAMTLDDLAKTASKILKFGGKFYMINDSDRIVEILEKLKKHNLMPKTIQFVFPKKEQNSNVVLIEAVKGGKEGSKILSLALSCNS